MLKVIRLLGDFGIDSMRTIPDHYRLKRWTLEARRKEVVDADASVGPSWRTELPSALNRSPTPLELGRSLEKCRLITRSRFSSFTE
ncbi:unnamed protein product [Linum trigynum]|uniref:Uncharacterized protein n=1 Tax=Linum trigynum TaxID=586398 RepID=A0AAV2DW09_9ROSI